jgi:hypothetical protein
MAADKPLDGHKLVIGKDQLPDYAEEIITTTIQVRQLLIEPTCF